MRKEEEVPSESKKGSLSRRDFLKLATVAGVGGGILAVIGGGFWWLDESLNNQEEKRRNLVVDLKDLIADPERYTPGFDLGDLGLLRTSGYPEHIGNRTVSVARNILIPKYLGTRRYTSWTTTEADFYKLHTTADAGSPAMELMAEKGTTYFPVESAGLTSIMTDKYQITGDILKFCEMNDKAEKFALQLRAVTKF